MEYISRDEALNFDMQIETTPSKINAVLEGMALYADYIKSIPAADVAPVKHGRWLEPKPVSYTVPGEESYFEQCSECNQIMSFPFSRRNDLLYCPYCGAKMDGDSNG